MASKAMRIVMYGSDFCGFCKKAGALLKKHNRPYEYIDTTTEKGAQQRTELSKKYNYHTIPMIFIDDKFIGGYDDLKYKVDTKELIL